MWDRNSLIIRVLPWLFGAVLLLFLIRLIPHSLGHVFPVLVSAVVVAAATAPAADAMERYRIPRGITVLAIYLIVALIFVGVAALMTPVILTETQRAADALPEYSDRITHLIERVAPGQSDQVSAERLGQQAATRAGNLLGRLASLALATGSLLIQLIIVLVMAYFMVVEKDFAQRVVGRFTPERHRARTLGVLGAIGSKLGHWARAQGLLALFFGVTFGVSLHLLGVQYAGTLGLVGAVLEVIPYLGGLVTLALAVVVAGTESPWLALWTVLVYTVIVQVEAHIVGPLLIGRAVGLHPLVIIIALFLGAETLGLLGALLSVPLAVVLTELLDEFVIADPPTAVSEHRRAG